MQSQSGHIRRRPAYLIMMSLNRLSKGRISNGVVKTCIPDSEYPYLRTAFSAYPVMKSA